MKTGEGYRSKHEQSETTPGRDMELTLRLKLRTTWANRRKAEAFHGEEGVRLRGHMSPGESRPRSPGVEAGESARTRSYSALRITGSPCRALSQKVTAICASGSSQWLLYGWTVDQEREVE